MSVICSKCSGTKISCEAMINPNTKEFVCYTDDSFDYGWCDDCNKGQVLTDTEKVKLEMEEAFNDYYAIHLEEPLYALCRVVFTDGNRYPEDMLFKLSLDAGEEDDKIFFYCNGMEDLKSLAGCGTNDFIIIDKIELFK